MAIAVGVFDEWADSLLDSSECDLDSEPLWSGGREPSSGAVCTLIETTHSTYLFLVITPAERLGLLVGGALGEFPTRALFRGAIPHESRASRHGSRPETTWRMVFEIVADGGHKHLITGPVVNVVQAPVDSHPTHEAQSAGC